MPACPFRPGNSFLKKRETICNISCLIIFIPGMRCSHIDDVHPLAVFPTVHTLPSLCAAHWSGVPITWQDFVTATAVNSSLRNIEEQYKCTPREMFTRQMASRRRFTSTAHVDETSLASVLSFMCGPPPNAFHTHTPVLPTRFPQSTGRFVIWTTWHVTGGPEAWVQLWRAMRDLGFDVSVHVSTSNKVSLLIESHCQCGQLRSLLIAISFSDI